MEEEFKAELYGVTPALFNEWRSPRYGISNPKKIDSKVWNWLARTKLSGYASTKQMDGPSPFNEGPTWSFDRFGQTRTELPDGRVVYVGGEHEDHYDPDFYIYNDVAVEMPSGDFEFYCYPKSVFPPTDFHSATLVNDKIVLIGSLGYPEERRSDATQIYLLDVNDFTISEPMLSGSCPGWIHGHEAALDPDGKFIVIEKGLIEFGKDHFLRENIDDWKLDIENWRWEKFIERNWPRWEITREDKKNNHIYDIRQALWSCEVNWDEHHEKDMVRLESSMGFRVDVNLVKALYNFEIDHEPLQKDEEQYNVFWIYVEGVRVRFIEEHYCLIVTVEGLISDGALNSIREQLIAKLTELEKTRWILTEY